MMERGKNGCFLDLYFSRSELILEEKRKLRIKQAKAEDCSTNVKLFEIKTNEPTCRLRN